MRNLFKPIGIVLGAAIVSLGLMHSAVAESEGAYVHGVARIGDEEIYFCRRLDVAVHIARRFNAVFAVGYSDEKFVKSGLAAEIEFFFKESKQCTLLKRVDQTSLKTIYVAPSANPIKRNVIESRMDFENGQFDTNFVLTGEAVPPCDKVCVSELETEPEK